MSKTIGAGDEWQCTFDALQDSIWVLDADQRIVRCNKASCELFGKTPDALIGRHCWEIVHGTREPIPECPMRRMRTSHHRESMDLAVGDRWYHVTVDPQSSGYDFPPWAVHVIRDITERKKIESKLLSLNRDLGQRVDQQTQGLQQALEGLERAQKAVQASEREKREILDSTREHMLLLDRNMTIRWPNRAACESVEMAREALTGRKCYTVWQDRTNPCPDCPVVLAMEQGEDCEAEKQTPDGKAWLIRGYPIRDEKGVVVGAVEMTRDITERKKAETLLIEQQQRLRQLAAKLANAQDEEQRRIAEGLHDDVGQLLAACRINLAVARGCESPEKAEDARRIAEDLLTEANNKIGILCFELGSSTLYRLGLHDAILELGASMDVRYGLHVDVSDTGSLAEVDRATSTVLFKAVRELLFNVVKHADVKDASVSVFRDDGGLNLVVTDHGKGFAHDNATEDIDSGRGCGLFGIRERLRDLGGAIHIESTPNVLTRVSLRVPHKEGE
jgi:PAS domain S-box-containing protein